MSYTIALQDIEPVQKSRVGGKALNLSRMINHEIPVPPGLCITTDFYTQYLQDTGIDVRIELELNRIPLNSMRWEELWDLALRIRNLFLQTPLPTQLEQELTQRLKQHFEETPVAIRSSSPLEDRVNTSFAGLHESFLNIVGTKSIIEHVRLVWASLWSDGALLYRKEMNMNVHGSSMAVVVQQLIDGDVSGIAFSISPENEKQAVIESVYGLNQGLVDDAITPDRWMINRKTKKIESFTPATRECSVRTSFGGIKQQLLTDQQASTPPLNDQQVNEVYCMSKNLEQIFGAPQDTEWTIKDKRLYILQTRPITTLKATEESQSPWAENDKRPWYLSLKRSFDNLKKLHQRIEFELLPEMDIQADSLARINLEELNDAHLIEAIKEREKIHKHWTTVYWSDFIPFAHGSRLFGQVYNDTVKPHDPHEFTQLLQETSMSALERNQELLELAGTIKNDSHLQQTLWQNSQCSSAFNTKLNTFLESYEDLTYKAVRFFKSRDGLIKLLLEMAQADVHQPVNREPNVDNPLAESFINHFPAEKHAFARELLEIGRSSYRLRDNDNIVLARIEAQLLKAVDEAKHRIAERTGQIADRLTTQQTLLLLSGQTITDTGNRQKTIDEPLENQNNPNLTPDELKTADDVFTIQARQLIGQPAGHGLAIGTARVIDGVNDLFDFKSGEILVCDCIDPNMTFIVPLASAIVERRGGMLVHGAIIAREYGLPCITGVADVTAVIKTGDSVTVDGYLGTVTINSNL